MFMKNWALRVLKLNKEQYVLAQQMDSPTNQRNWALKFLTIDVNELTLLRNIREDGGPFEYAHNLLGVTADKLQEFFTWDAKSKVEKLKSLVKEDESIRGFFNRTYADYKAFKRNHKAAWKKMHWRKHITEVQQILDDIIINDEMTWQQARTIAMRTYFAIWCNVRKVPVNTPKAVTRTIPIKSSPVAAAA